MIVRRTSVKAVSLAAFFCVLGVAALLYGESMADPSLFSGAGRSWNNWHFLSIGFFVFAAALVFVGFRFAEKDD